MDYSWVDAAGNLGVLLVLGMYLMTHLQKIATTSFLYSFANALGAALILWSLVFDFNLSAFVIEAAWLLVSCIGLLLYFFRRRTIRLEESQ